MIVSIDPGDSHMPQDEFHGHTVENALAQATGRAPVLEEKQSAICQRLLNDVELALQDGERLFASLRGVENDIRRLIEVAARRGASTVALALPIAVALRNWRVALAGIGALAKGHSGRAIAFGAAIAAVERALSEGEFYRDTFREMRAISGQLREIKRNMQELERRIERLRSEFRRNNCRLGGQPTRNIFGQGRFNRRR
jgi:hypothetical protein